MSWNLTPVVVSPMKAIKTEAAPINPDWILEGAPCARAATLSRSEDGTAVTVAWECTGGRFRWRFLDDETVHIIEGSVTISWNGEEHTLKAGDGAFFPAKTVADWTVHGYVRKIAFIRVPPPKTISLGLKVWRRISRMVVGQPQVNAAQPLEPRSA